MQGLKNLGATCAVNSLIQIICRNEYLRKSVLDNECNPDTLSNHLKEILDLMYNQNNSISPKKFILKLYKTFDGFFRLGEQLDIGELWMILHDKFCSEYGISINSNNIEIKHPDISTENNKQISQSQEIVSYCNYTIDKINNYKVSKWQNISQGILLNMITCSCCKKVLYNFEPFISIPIDVIDNSNVVSMFKEYLIPRSCQGDWYCEHCKEYTKYVKRVKIWKMPKVLIFLIKRFNENFSKNNSSININDKICIKKGSVLNNMLNDFNYELSSMALHYGNLHGGHYCSICKTNEEYYLYDDLNVTKINDDFCKNNREVYMVIYSKVV